REDGLHLSAFAERPGPMRAVRGPSHEYAGDKIPAPSAVRQALREASPAVAGALSYCSFRRVHSESGGCEPGKEVDHQTARFHRRVLIDHRSGFFERGLLENEHATQGAVIGERTRHDEFAGR